MKELEERIRQEGTVKVGNVLKVDAFLNHQCDVALFDAQTPHDAHDEALYAILSDRWW